MFNFYELAFRTTIAFKPIASIGGQGYYLEGVYVIRKDGAELLMAGVPYSAQEIEAAMQTTDVKPRSSR